jgi:hypothetical protein
VSARIQGFVDAVELFAQTQIAQRDDPYEVARKLLLPQAANVVGAINRFREKHRSAFSPPAYVWLETDSLKPYLDARTIEARGKVLYCAAFLAGLRSQFEYLAADHSAAARSLTERAFSHLQRSLVADRDLQARWKAAFAGREEQIERLGAVHLLSHGVWAFKAHSADGAGNTDLVLGTSIDLGEVERSSEALVLTEWKKIAASDDPVVKTGQAQAQAAIYSGGVLGGVELRSTRYLVLVGEREFRVPEDRQVGDILYRVVALIIEPSAPSKAARMTSKQ